MYPNEMSMYHIPMCVVCEVREVTIVVNSVGSGYCSPKCEHIAMVEDEKKEYSDSLLARQYETV